MSETAESNVMEEEIAVHNGRIAEVPIDKLVPSPLNNFEMVDIDEMAESILHFGLLTPLTVVDALENGMYEILSGERRYRAALILHEKDPNLFATIPCMIKAPEEIVDDDIKSLLIQLANLEMRTDYNKDQHRFQVIGLLNRLCENGTFKRKDLIKKIAKSMGMTTRYARMYDSVFKYGSDDLKDAVINHPSKSSDGDTNGEGEGENSGHITISLASRIANLPEEEQNEIVRRKKEGMSAEEAFRSVLDEHREESSSMPEKEDTPIAGSEYWGSSGQRISIEGGANRSSSLYSWKSTPAATPAAPVEELHNHEGEFLDGEYPEESSEIEVSEEELSEEDTDDDEYFDELEGIDSMDFLRENSTDVNLEIDTSRLIGGLKSAKIDDGEKERDAKVVRSWARRMMKRDSFKDLDDVHLEALRAVLELAKYIQEQGLEDELDSVDTSEE